MEKSIKTRLVKSFMLIIIITVFILEVALINGVKSYYYGNIEDLLVSQTEFSLDYYLRYLSSSKLEDIVLDDVDVFWRHTNAQVQILDIHGNILMDSLGVTSHGKTMPTDIEKSINGERGLWIGNVDYFDKPVMSISTPIKDKDSMIGIIRFITSLEETNNTIHNISFLLLGMGLIVIFISGAVSIFLANSIVKPLQQVTTVAERIADGELKIRSNVTVKDEIGKLSDTLNYMAEELIKKEQIKNDFISSVSHELRTPLTSIKGWAITLKSENISDNEILLDGLNIIEKESDRLSSMVEELLDFSKFVSGRIKLEKEQFNIVDTIEIISKQLYPRAVSNKIKFELDIDSSIGIILGDENRIKQVLINLLDNAFKFTPKGGKIKLSVAKENSQVILIVEDNGLGISKKDLPHVKEKFYKGGGIQSDSGIGLSICEEIVGLHDGSIEILSELNKGTTVIVRLPVRGVSI